MLAALVRERQDLVAEWQKRDRARSEAFSQAPEKRNPEAVAANVTRLAEIDGRVSEIDARLKDAFPSYASLAHPEALRIEDVKALLHSDEALVLFLDTPAGEATPEETFLWVVTKTEAGWICSALGTSALSREVQGLRCGLDEFAWDDKPCAELTGQGYTDADRDAGKPLPFDHARAYALYEALFGQAEYLIKGKQLLIVPSGALTQLPFQVLVTAPPSGGDNKSAAWLIRDHALTVLPVSSLKALRRVARPSAATKPMIGFGNPLLDGDQSHPKFGAYFKGLAQRARDKQHCPETVWNASPRLLDRGAVWRPYERAAVLRILRSCACRRRFPRQPTNFAPWHATCTLIRTRSGLASVLASSR